MGTWLLPYPPLPLQSPTPCHPPPPPETVTFMFFELTSIAVACVAHLPYTLHCIAFLLLQINHLCVFCDTVSPKALYVCVVLLFQTQDGWSPGDRVWYHSRILGAHVLTTVVGPSPNGPQFCHIRYIRPGCVLDESHWHCINTTVASPVFSLLASAEGTPVCLEIPLQPPPPPGRPSLCDRPLPRTVAR